MKFIVIIIFLFVSSTAYSQLCMTIDEYDGTGKKISELDKNHPSAVIADSEESVFLNREEEMFEAWKSLLIDIGQFLHENEFFWGKPTRCFNRVYFSKTGKIEVFLFDFKTKIDEEKINRFKELLAEFVNDYKIKIKEPANRKFSQCGMALFKDRVD